MDSKRVAEFFTGIAVSRGFRFALAEKPYDVLSAIGFDEAETREISQHLNALPKGGPAHGTGKLSTAAAPWAGEAAPWSAEVWSAGGTWSPEGAWAPTAVWAGQTRRQEGDQSEKK